ncbi:ubiquinone-binding protein COQ10 [Saccharomyces paradoxus]|uniref:Coenzyme Q-binding protein COQ10, mitochondrial n=1 Tax=Saccharomyces paradoxus TaxID=27291 RepID=A0A8B8UZE8_SACPA|nr:Coq10 [Saccharomyces paradoxus]QHS76112.1 Coq10 [Saccharomyces paradoxus]
MVLVIRALQTSIVFRKAMLKPIVRYPLKRSFFGLSSTNHTIREQRYVLRKTINTPPSTVYAAVSEVAQYKEFIPYCVDSFVDKRNPVDNKPVIGGLRVGFKQYDEEFICNITCKDTANGNDTYTVIAETVSHNLFHLLYSKWTIMPHPSRPNAAMVELLLRFKFKSRIYNSVSLIFAKTVTELVMNAFAKRAYHLVRLAMLKPSSKESSQ